MKLELLDQGLLALHLTVLDLIDTVPVNLDVMNQGSINRSSFDGSRANGAGSCENVDGSCAKNGYTDDV